MTEFVKCPTTLTCLVRQQLVYSEPEVLASTKIAGKGDLCRLLGAIQTACKIISQNVRQTASNSVGRNMFGDASDAPANGLLDSRTFAHQTLSHFLVTSGQLCVASSESTSELVVPPKELTGEFCVTFDPLDGYTAMNPDSNAGTMFGIYRRLSDSGPQGKVSGTIKDILQPSKNLIASGYTIYGTNTILVFATNHEVNGFSFDAGIGEFVLTQPKLKISPRGRIYSINEGLSLHWDDAVAKFVACCKRGSDERPAHSLRFISGTTVGNIHSVLCCGGIFLSPVDGFCSDAKHRVLHKCGPISFIFNAAGGRAYSGSGNVEDIEPKCADQISAIFAGSKVDVDDLENFCRGNSCTAYHTRSAGA